MVEKKEEQVLDNNIDNTGGQEQGADNTQAEETAEREEEQKDCCEEQEGEEPCVDETGENQDGEDKDETVSRKEKRKKEKKDKKDEKIQELTDRVTRQMAEFDNFRKRSEKEKSQMFEIGAKNIIERVLPVIDNFERGLAAVPKEQQEDGFVEGMNKVYKQLMTALEEAGVKVIEAVGKEFDPNLHNAVMHIEDENLGENIVAEEFQKGYMYHDTVVRHSMVKVAN